MKYRFHGEFEFLQACYRLGGSTDVHFARPGQAPTRLLSTLNPQDGETIEVAPNCAGFPTPEGGSGIIGQIVWDSGASIPGHRGEYGLPRSLRFLAEHGLTHNEASKLEQKIASEVREQANQGEIGVHSALSTDLDWERDFTC